VFVFSEHFVERLLAVLEQRLPVAAADAIRSFAARERARLHSHSQQAQGSSTLSVLWNLFIACMLLYFVVSLGKSLAQQQLKHLDTQWLENKRRKRQ